MKIQKKRDGKAITMNQTFKHLQEMTKLQN